MIRDLFVPLTEFAPFTEAVPMATVQVDFDALMAKVNQVGGSKKAADDATAAGNAAHAALAQAQADVSAKDAAEAQADAKLKADFDGLRDFVDGLDPVPVPPAPPATTG